MDKKVLIMAPSALTIVFNLDNIQMLQGLGCTVHVAANFEPEAVSGVKEMASFKNRLSLLGVICHHIPFARRSLFKNIPSINQYRKLLIAEKFAVVHCHTETGGLLTRLAMRGKFTKSEYVIYTPHGFHFYRGAPFIYWVLYYPIERWICLRMNELISINHNDYVKGVGLNSERFQNQNKDREAKRMELGVPKNDVMVLSVGELCKWKNHKTVMKAVAKLNNPDLYYVICGRGVLENRLKKTAIRLGIEKQLILTGYRSDMPEVYSAADLFAFPSLHEGLPVALMEAMSAGLPAVCSNVRGVVELIQNNKGGFLLKADDVNGFATAIGRLAGESSLRKRMGNFNMEAVKQFDLQNVRTQMKKIYEFALSCSLIKE
jgi:glycosyltransferase involved in cell wall biosynthesis